LSANTVAAYRRDLAKFAEWLAARSVAALSVRDLADYAGWLHARKLAPASIARHVVSLKVFFR
jgi:integrase/recombinase XerD